MEVESKSRCLESKVREAVEMAVRVEVERDAAHHEVAMGRLKIDAAGSARAQMESELACIHHALAASKVARRKVESELDGAQEVLAVSIEAGRKTEEEVSRLTDERVSLLVELGGSKDELSTFRAEATKDKKALEVEYDAGFEVIFNYGYGCYAFTHNICGSKLRILAGMQDMITPLTPEFFVNPRCPPDAVPGKAVAALEVDISEEVERSSTVGMKEGDNPDSPSRIAGDMEEPGAAGES